MTSNFTKMTSLLSKMAVFNQIFDKNNVLKPKMVDFDNFNI